MVRWTKNITEHRYFINFIIGVILLSALLVGLKTYPDLYRKYSGLFYTVDILILAVFTLEIILKLIAHMPRPLRYFKSGWNVFDFIVTALFYIPGISQYSSILRVFRVLRVLRLVTALPRLQMLVGALLASLPSMFYIGILLFILFYIYAIIGNVLFGATDQLHFANLHVSLITLFQIVTLEGWVEVMRAQQPGWYVIPYFISFILLGTMIILNLFIGVIMNGFDEVKKDLEQEAINTKGKPSH
jgi:voltage-gated sodium channel